MHRLFPRPLILPLLLASVALPATAQETPVPLGEIVLGAGAPKVAIDTPQAVTVVDQEDIDAAQATNPAELFDAVPGVQAIGSDRAAGISFNIRGIGELAASDESKIIVTVDDATKFHEQYRVGSFFGEPELYKRVEVLRGPASSTLYGAGALGGVIAFETKDAGDFLDPGDSGALRFKSGGETNGAGGFGSVIWAARPNARLEFLGALTYRRGDDYEDGDGNAVSGSEFEALSGLAKATFRIDDAQAVRLSFQAFDSDLDDTAYSQTGTLPFGTIDRRVTDQTLTLSYENAVPTVDWLNLDVTLSYSDTEVEQSNASAPIPSPLFADSVYAYRTLGLKVENTATAGFGAWNAYFTYGLQVSEQERVAETSLGPLGFHPEGTDWRIGLYGQAEFVWNDRLTLIPGLRIDRSDLTPGDGVVGSTDIDRTSVSPKLAALYRFNDQFSAFGSISRTERVPTLDELYSSDPTENEVAALTLESETSEAYELGLAWTRSGVVGGDLALKATAFHYDIDDLIERDSAANTPFYRQVGSARLRGIELEGAWEAERAFARLAYAHVDGEDRTTGEQLTSVPAENLSLSLGGRAPGIGLEYGWEGTFVDDIETPGVRGERFGGYAVHDLYLGWSPQTGPLEGLGVRVGVDNVFDRDFRSSLAGDDGVGRNVKVSLTRGVTW